MSKASRKRKAARALSEQAVNVVSSELAQEQQAARSQHQVCASAQSSMQHVVAPAV